MASDVRELEAGSLGVQGWFAYVVFVNGFSRDFYGFSWVFYGFSWVFYGFSRDLGDFSKDSKDCLVLFLIESWALSECVVLRFFLKQLKVSLFLFWALLRYLLFFFKKNILRVFVVVVVVGGGCCCGFSCGFFWLFGSDKPEKEHSKRFCSNRF